MKKLKVAIFHEIPVILWTYYKKICNTNLFQICLQVPRKYVSVICSSVAMKGITYFYVASLVFLQAFYSITANGQIFHLIFCLCVCKSKLLQRISRCNDRLELSFCTCHTCINWAYSLTVNSFFIGNFQIIFYSQFFIREAWHREIMHSLKIERRPAQKLWRFWHTFYYYL